MVDRRDIELVLRATDQTSKQFADVKRAVEGLTTALGQQLTAAEKGDASFGELKDTLRKLEQAGTALIQQQGLIDLYRNLGTQLEGAKTKAGEAREAFDRLKASHAEGAKLTKDQRQELADFSREAKSAEKSVVSLSDRIAKQAEKLHEAGIAVHELDTAQAQLATTAQQAGAGLASARSAVEGYAGQVKALKAAEQAQQDALAASLAPTRSILEQKAAAAKAAADAAKLAAKEQADALALAMAPTRLVVGGRNAAAATAAKAEADALAQALAPARLVAQNRAQQDADAAALAKTLAGYRALADQLGQTTARYTTLGDVTTTVAERISRVTDALRAINDPAAAQRSTLGGLEAQVLGIQAAVSAASGPVKDYELQLRSIAEAQRAAGQQAAAIDAYRQQMAVLRAARAEFVQARAAVNEYAQQLRSTTAPNDELKAKAQAATTALAAASREMQGQFARAAQLREGLTAAGLATNKLADEERRLVDVARTATTAAAKLNEQFEKSGRSTAGKGLFGLSPYAIQNLGYQLNDIFVQISSGTSIMQTASQQVPQILQGIPGAFNAILARLPLVIAGATAAAAAITLIGRALEEAGARRNFEALLTASADGANYQTEALVRAQRTLQDFGNSADESAKALREFMDNGIRQDRIDGFARASQNLVDVFKLKLPDAAKALAEGFSGGWQQVFKLNEQFNFLDAGTAARIQKLFDEGKSVEALALAFAALEGKIGPAAAAVNGPFTTAMRDARTAISDMFTMMANTPSVQMFVYSMGLAARAVGGLSRAVSAFISTSSDAQIARAEAAAALANTALDRAKAFVDRGGDPRAVAAAEQRVTAAEAALAKLRAERGAQPTAAPGGAATNTGDNAQQIRDEEFLRKQRERLDQGDRENAQDRIKRAGLEALRQAQEARLSPEAQLQAQRNAEADTLKDIEKAEAAIISRSRERLDAQRQQSREQQISAAGETAYREARTAGAREEIREQARANAELAKRRELELGESGRIEALRNRLAMTREQTAAERIQAAGEEAARVARAAGDTREGVAEQARIARELKQREIAREGVGAANQRVNLERELQNELSQLRSTADRQEKTQLDARLRAVDERYARIFQNIDRLKATGATEVQGTPIAAFAAQIEAQKQLIKNAETLKFYEDSLNAATRERADVFKDIAARQEAGEISASEALRQQQDATARITPRMHELANEAERFARGIRGATPDPRLDAFIARMQRLGNVDQGGAGTDAPARAAAQATVARQTTEVNRLFAERNTLADTYTQLAAKGAITQTEADDKIRAAFTSTHDTIQAAVVELQRVNENAFKAGDITATQFNLTNAKIMEMGASLQYVSPLLKTLQQGFSSAFGSAFSTALNSASESIAGLIDGTKSWKDALKDAGSIALNFVAELLKGIAMTIIQFYALRVASSLMKSVGLGADAASGITQTTAAAATTTAAVELGAASGFLTVGATELGVSAGLLMAAAQTLIVANTIRAAAVVHEGGVIGSVLNRSRAAPASWFAGAPRYHAGGMAGLAPNEVPAILERGEEVLNAKNPRHILNQGRGDGAGAGSSLAIRNVLVVDPSMITEAMSSSQGERVTVASIRKNAGTIKSILGVR